jgi:hypothetical protein
VTLSHGTDDWLVEADLLALHLSVLVVSPLGEGLLYVDPVMSVGGNRMC